MRYFSWKREFLLDPLKKCNRAMTSYVFGYWEFLNVMHKK